MNLRVVIVTKRAKQDADFLQKTVRFVFVQPGAISSFADIEK